MAIVQIETPADALTTNQWWLEFNGNRIATFHKIDGMAIGEGVLERADGGTGLTIHFPDGKVMCDQMTWTRVVDPSDPADDEIEDMFIEALENKTKYDAVLVKMHKGVELFRYRFYGLLFSKAAQPSLDKTTSALYEVVYTVDCDYYEKIRSAA